MIKRLIPSSGEELPIIGLGTWKSFDAPDKNSYPELSSVLQIMHAAGGRVIDSSPMYGRSEQVIGDISSEMEYADDFFYATKVWTTGMEEGILEMESSMQKMKRKTMDLIQVHNLVDWKTHWHTLRHWKQEGKIRYTGITHYRDAFHDELIEVMRIATPDFVQFNYSVFDRHAADYLLPAAAEMGIATIINRPFGEGKFFSEVRDKALPDWAAEIEVDNWASFFLKYIIAHPAVTCVIPATSNPQHAADNFKAGTGILPDHEMLRRMEKFVDKI